MLTVVYFIPWLTLAGFVAGIATLAGRYFGAIIVGGWLVGSVIASLIAAAVMIERCRKEKRPNGVWVAAFIVDVPLSGFLCTYKSRNLAMEPARRTWVTERPLLVAEGFDGVHAGGLDGGVKAEADADEAGDDEGADDGPGGDGSGVGAAT